jgi:hypothetical protein
VLARVVPFLVLVLLVALPVVAARAWMEGGMGLDLGMGLGHGEQEEEEEEEGHREREQGHMARQGWADDGRERGASMCQFYY